LNYAIALPSAERAEKASFARTPRFGERKKSADGPSTAAAAAAASSVAFF
jgi:hypothetical protein